MTSQTPNNNLNYLIDPKFTKVERFFVILFENENDRTSFSKYYVPNVQIKDVNVLIDGKSFFDMGRNNYYTAGKILDYKYFSKHCKLIATDLPKQIKLENPDLKQQINFIGRITRNEEATTFFIIEESEETATVV